MSLQEDPLMDHLYGKIIFHLNETLGKRLLDIGCGAGKLSTLAAQKGFKVVGIDREKKAVAIAKKRANELGLRRNCQFLVADFEKLKFFKSEVFDVVVCSEVVEHVPRPEKFIRKAKRLLKKGGLFILTTPNNSRYWTVADEYAQHYRRFEIDQLKRIFLNFKDFKIVHLYTIGFPGMLTMFLLYNFWARRLKIDHSASWRKRKFIKTIYYFLVRMLLKIDDFFNSLKLGTNIVLVARRSRDISLATGDSQKLQKILRSEPDPAFKRRAQIVFENIGLKNSQRVLDVGCGRGFYLKGLSCLWMDLRLYGIDSNSQYLKTAKHFIGEKSTQLIKADATRLPFKNNFFDRIIASEILEHLKDDQKAIAEIDRVLKPGGKAIITVPNRNYPPFWDPLNWLLEKLLHVHFPPNIWWLAGIWADHYRLYEQEELVAKLERVGFKIEKIWRTTHYCLPFSHFLFYGIGKNLLEKGFLTSFNRFVDQPKQSFLNKLLLWPVRKIDDMNDNDKTYSSSVNIIVKVRKLKPACQEEK